jgi:uncharacterized protein (DUF2141 family)
MRLNKNLHWIIYLLFIASCAKQTSPTGGPKDTIPPVLVKSIPANNSLNFEGKEIELLFSEMVVLNNPKEQLIVTPTIGKNFEVLVKKNSVILKLNKELHDSTTYTFNFRESIQDITEKNPVRNFKIAISTGPYIDSLSIAGTITDLLKEKEIKDATVAIFKVNDTINILKHPATYFTRTDDKGKYKIDNLKPGAYSLYSFEDKNRNLIVDSKNESYGFLKDSITLKANIKDKSLSLIHLDARPLKLTSTRPYNTFYNIRTSKNIIDFSIKADSDVYYSFGEDQSNIRLYNNGYPDSLKINFTAKDSIGNSLDTVLYAKFSKQEVTPEKFTASISDYSILEDKGILKTTLKFNKPLKEINFDSIYFIVDSLKKINFSKEDLTWNPYFNTIKIFKRTDKSVFKKPAKETNKTNTQREPKTKNAKQKDQKPEIQNSFYLGDAAFISIESDTSKSLSQNIKPQKTEDLGIIIFDVETTEKNFIVQLLDKNLSVLRSSTTNKTKGQFDDLPPGEYQLRIIIDKNGDQQWSPGNYIKKQEPEPIKYYASEKKLRMVPLKANFEISLLITY